MASDSAFCALMPHAPIVVPAMSHPRPEECVRTSSACDELAARLVAARPDRMFLISPHAPRVREGFGIWSGNRLRGDLGPFGAEETSIDLPNDRHLIHELATACDELEIGHWSIPEHRPLDHGSVVPLWFLTKAGWSGPTCVASLPVRPTPRSCVQFGRALGVAAGAIGGSIARIASGDLTHRAIPGSPAGYDPRAVGFDHALRDLVAAGRLRGIPRIDPRLRALAAEDAADTSTIVSASIGFQARGPEVLSYEHPFGVGYLVAVFGDGRPL